MAITNSNIEFKYCNSQCYANKFNFRINKPPSLFRLSPCLHKSSYLSYPHSGRLSTSNLFRRKNMSFAGQAFSALAHPDDRRPFHALNHFRFAKPCPGKQAKFMLQCKRCVKMDKGFLRYPFPSPLHPAGIS